MKANEILNKIKNIVGEKTLLSDDLQEIELAELRLENGTVLVSENFKSGESVFIKTEDEEVALPIGEYELEDERILVVKEEGLIDTIKEAIEEENMAEENLENENEMEQNLEEHEEKEKMEKYVTREEFAKAVDEIKMMIEAMDHKKDKMAEQEKAEEVKEELSAVQSEPVKHNPEAVEENKLRFNISQNRILTTRDRAMNRIFNK